jgi:hypothetical protein
MIRPQVRVLGNMAKRPRAWDYVRANAAGFDVALLQETADPRLQLGDQWSSVIWRPMPGDPALARTRFGSAVIGRSLALEEYRPEEAYPWRALGGSVTIARSTSSPAWFASVHAYAGKIPQNLLDAHRWDDVPVSTPNGTLWETDVIPFELHRLFAGKTYIWGGDLNRAEIMDDQGFVGGNRKLRQIWHEAGSRDLRRRFFEDEQQTFYAPSRRPYQLDHVFADAVTETRVTDWRIDTEPVTAQPSLSDHAPISVDLL